MTKSNFNEYSNNKNMIIVVSGPSGVGKDTVVKRLVEKYGDYAISVSYTDRSPRVGEQEGEDYFFVTKEKFLAMIDEDAFLEHKSYSDHNYGTPKLRTEELLSKGKHVILVIEVQGGLEIIQKGIAGASIFISPPKWSELERRLNKRGTEDSEKIAKRLCTACNEIASAEKYDYIVVNDDIEHCADKIHTIVTAAAHRSANMTTFIQEVIKDAKTVNVSDN